MSSVTGKYLADIVAAISTAINEERDELNRLDSALGDGDHGTSLSVAFADVVAKLRALQQPDPAVVLQTTAQSLMNRMGGASGALYGTMFLRASGAAKDKITLTHDDMKGLWQRALDGVMQRGKAQPGDKTMVDALHPAVRAFTKGESLTDSFERAAAAASIGAAQTATMVARHGRAKFAGERAVGHVDTGAQSIALMFAAMNTYWKDAADGKT